MAYNDRADKAAVMTPLIVNPPSFYYRAKSAWRMLVDGRTPDWFGPGSPIDPMAPEQTKGRQFDYPVGSNIVAQQPKANEGVPFSTLRVLADQFDLMRVILESFKDQLCKMDWQIARRDIGSRSSHSDAKSDKIENVLAFPDGTHAWDDWLRMVLEDVLVVDALCIWPVRDNGAPRFEIIDGTTIKRVIDDRGRTPQPPVPAYQQILKGIPANDYLATELIYKPRNVRSWKLYGFSVVEQTIVTITMALWRQASQMNYYTDGSTPDLIMPVPGDWSTDQIAKFKMWWDSILLGNTAERRGTMFYPETKSRPFESKDKVLTDKMEEWIARVLCFSLRVSPISFISSYNRATAETAKKQAKEDGVGSMMMWIKRLMDMLLARYFDAKEYEFRWKEDDETDPFDKAKLNDIKIRNGSKTINEARAEDGEDPIEGGDVALIITPSGAIRLQDAVKAPLTGTNVNEAQQVSEKNGAVAGADPAPAKKPDPQNTVAAAKN